MEDDLKKQNKNGRRPKKINKNGRRPQQKMEDEPINLIGCDTIVNSPS